MSYQVLARKWRPGNFDELVGQEQTARALINALDNQRLHHAYLFTGTRGVGKTTIARIFSKSLNCEKGVTSTPCGTCSSCVEIAQGNFVDLLEIDAASKTKVEDTRELLDNVQYRPTRGRYKVYLIDEVHMLSGHSFNALLKTLEEPPPHVIFLLATTDPQKLPVTVLSRCLQFHLRPMQPAEIIAHLQKILNAEVIEFEQAALAPIAKGADGSMRDALSLLDQAIAYCGGKIEAAVVFDMLGSIDRNYAYELLAAISAGQAEILMQVIGKIAEFSPDFDALMADWLSLLHAIAVCQATGVSDDEQIEHLASAITTADLQLYYQLSLQSRRDLAFAPHPRQGFEMAMLRILAFKPHNSSATLSAPTGGQKKKLNHTTVNQEAAASVSSIPASPSAQAVEVRPADSESAVSEPPALTKAFDTEHWSSQAAQNHPESGEKKRLALVIDNSSNKPLDPKLPRLIEQPEPGSSVLDEPSILVDEPINRDTQDAIPLPQVNEQNWYRVTDSLSFEGNGFQVLLNSLGQFINNRLQVSYLRKVSPLLTESTQARIVDELRQFFADENLLVNFEAVDCLAETPKERRARLLEQALNEAEASLKQHPQISYLIETLGVVIPRESIRLPQSK